MAGNQALTALSSSGTSCTMTDRTSSGSRVRGPVTELEREVLEIVWELGPASVEAVHARLSQRRDLKETSTRTMLRRLEQKGYLQHKSDGRAYIYHAAEPPRNVAARAVRQIIDSFCSGSLEELVSGMVDAKVLSPAELDRLEQFVRRQRK